MLARCRVHEVSQEWGCEWGSSYMNESIHSVSSHDCRFLRSRMRCSSLLITPPLPGASPRSAAALHLHLELRNLEGLRACLGPASCSIRCPAAAEAERLRSCVPQITKKGFAVHSRQHQTH